MPREATHVLWLGRVFWDRSACLVLLHSFPSSSMRKQIKRDFWTEVLPRGRSSGLPLNPLPMGPGRSTRQPSLPSAAGPGSPLPQPGSPQQGGEKPEGKASCYPPWRRPPWRGCRGMNPTAMSSGSPSAPWGRRVAPQGLTGAGGAFGGFAARPARPSSLRLSPPWWL